MAINPNIRQTVDWLNANGFQTVDSGDGETRDHACDRASSYVVVTVPPNDIYEEANRLLTLLTKRGIRVSPIGQGEIFIQANYDPVNRLAFLDITGIHDSYLRSPL